MQFNWSLKIMDIKFKSQNLFFHLPVFESWEIIREKRERWETDWLILISMSFYWKEKLHEDDLDSLSCRENKKLELEKVLLYSLILVF
jgi:hypothetical protein